ncbi:hypothetical protein [Actinopolymorpha alba]|uniref:hypothetical protein n=1 Tax=Actinopolymorpha alba TaxID=533267 RepID=UPI00036B68FF|nr:hypothetical protein [Actinopolymorpha alba]
MRQFATVTAAALLALAGCAPATGDAAMTEPAAESATPSVTAKPSTSTPAATPSPTAKPSATPLSKEQARERYLQIVAPYNRSLERLEQAFNTGKPVSKLRVLAASVEESNATQIRALRSTRWPANLRAPIGDLIAESNAAQKYWRRAAAARTRQELGQAAVAASRHDGSVPAGKVRKLLGLDDYDENDYS